jgi:hypothetical protein
MVQLRILVLILAASVLACSKAKPEFELLDSGLIPQPKFAGSTTKNIEASSDSVAYSITGECDPKIRSISAMAVGISTTFGSLDSIAAAPASVDCATSGTFGFQLKSLAALGYTAVEGTAYEIQLKGFTSSGYSNPSYIRILYINPVSAPRLMFGGGGVHATPASEGRRVSSANFQADLRLNFLTKAGASAEQSTSTNFRARLGGSSR